MRGARELRREALRAEARGDWSEASRLWEREADMTAGEWIGVLIVAVLLVVSIALALVLFFAGP